MMGYAMRYQEELRDPAEYFKDIKKVAINEDSLELAMELIKRKAAKFDPSQFKDQYEAAVRELVEAKVKHAPIPKDEVEAPRRGQVINLMERLQSEFNLSYIFIAHDLSIVRHISDRVGVMYLGRIAEIGHDRSRQDWTQRGSHSEPADRQHGLRKHYALPQAPLESEQRAYESFRLSCRRVKRPAGATTC